MAKHPGGRPTKYKPEYCEQIVKFFACPKNERVVKSITTGKNEYEKTEYTTIPNELPTFAKFARSIGVAYDTVCDWVKVHPEFLHAHNEAKRLQEEFLIDNGLAGLYPPASYIFTAKNITTMRDKTEVEHSGGISLTELFESQKKNGESKAS